MLEFETPYYSMRIGLERALSENPLNNMNLAIRNQLRELSNGNEILERTTRRLTITNL
jgi:hypothetical protein